MFLNDIFESTDDDMFKSGPNLTQKLGSALINYGEGVLVYADDLVNSTDPETRDYVSDLKSKAATYIRAGQAFEDKGMQAGIMEWVLIDISDREEFVDYTKEVDNWDPTEIINSHLGLKEEDDMFADRRTAKIGRAIIDAGRVLIDDAPYRWGDDQEMVDLTIQDGNDMITVGETFIEQGIEAGIDAMFRLDTMVRDQIWDAANSVGVDLNDHINESDEDMFAQRGKADVAKISTDQLRNMYSLAMSDSRQEYASAHKLQMARISTELKRRGVSVPVRESDDMFAGSNRALDQIKQDRHPLKDYISFEQFEMLMDEFDDLKAHTTQHYEQDAYLHALKQVDGLPEEFFDVIEYYMYAPTKTNAENDTKLHSDLNNAFRRTWTEYKPSTMIGFLARTMSRACLAAIREKDDVDLDESNDLVEDKYSMIINELFENADDDMFAGPRSVGGKYWNNPSAEYHELYNALVPDSGAAKTIEGELLRAATRLYHDYFNNGFGNNVSGAENFIRTFGPRERAVVNALNVIHPYTRCDNSELDGNKRAEQQVEIALDVIVDYVIRQIQQANGNYHPNTDDMFNYSDEDDPDPYQDDEEDYSWQDDDNEDEDEY